MSTAFLWQSIRRPGLVAWPRDVLLTVRHKSKGTPLSFSAARVFWVSLLLVCVPSASGAQSLVAAVLPSSRSVRVGTPATAFATLINTGSGTATGCTLAPSTSVPATFAYQMTDPATNVVTGSANAPVDIPAGQLQTFVFSFTPTAAFAPTDVQLSFACANAAPATVIPGVNTLLLSAATAPVPDIIALAATLTQDGIANVDPQTSVGVFAVATVNVGSSGAITVTADTGGASLPLSLTVCETNPATGACLAPPAGSVSTQIDANATPTFGIFITGLSAVPFDPTTNRIFVRFSSADGVIRGATSVAVRTAATERLERVAGNKQVGQPGQALPGPLKVRLKDQLDRPVVGKVVTAKIVQGQGEFVEPTTARSSGGTVRMEVTDSDGTASFFLRGTAEGVIRTQVSALDQQVEFQTFILFIKPVAIAVERNGSLVVADAFGVVRVDPHSGTRVLVSGADPVMGLPVGSGLRFNQDRLVGIAVERDGHLVVVGPDSVINSIGGTIDAVVRVNPNTGDREVVSGDPAAPGGRGSGPPLQFPGGIAVEASDQLVVVDGAFGLGLKAVVRVDARTGNRTIVTSDTTGSGPSIDTARGIAVEANGQLVLSGEFIDGTGRRFTAIVRVAPGSGNRTVVTSVDTCRDGTGRPILTNPTGIAVEADGRLVVLNNSFDFDALAVVRVDPVRGGCSLVSRPRGALRVGAGPDPDVLSPTGVAVEADGRLVVVDDRLGAVVRVDHVTGDRTTVARPARTGTGLLLLDPINIAVERDGHLIVLDSFFSRVARVDPLTGDRTVVSGIDYETGLTIGGGRGFFGALVGVAVAPDGSVLVTDVAMALAAIVQVDPRTGARAAVSGCIDVDRNFQCTGIRGSGPFLRRPEGLALAANGQIMVVDGVRDGGLGAVVRVDPGTGDRRVVSGCTAVDNQGRCSVATIGGGPLFTDPSGIISRADGKFLVTDGDLGVVQVDPVTGDRTVVSGVDPATGNRLLGGIVTAADGSVVVTEGSGTGEQTDAAVVRVDLVTGRRSLVSGRGTGNGLRLLEPLQVAVEADGALVVVDTTLAAVVRVDPRTGNRRIVSR
jgi:sugar lactone lactonase YvrE